MTEKENVIRDINATVNNMIEDILFYISEYRHIFTREEIAAEFSKAMDTTVTQLVKELNEEDEED